MEKGEAFHALFKYFDVWTQKGCVGFVGLGVLAVVSPDFGRDWS